MNALVAGVQLGVAQAGIKKVDRDDLVVIALAPGTRTCLLYTSPSPRDISGSRMPSSA